ncbi:MAG: hypothetical protein JST49_02005, partial [Bacteroidetes bacterium]|nr:hypothetical protein [Bacteroidota bacterium]
MENKSEIEVYEYHEHIRLRTGMYIGGVDDRGILALIKGLTDDITGRVSSTVSIKYTILDNYNIELLISSLQSDVIHTSFIATDYFNQNIYPLSAKALCSSFSVSYRGQQQKFEKGVKVSSEACSNSDVLNIKLAIDKSIFSNIDLDYYLLCRTLYYVAILNPLSRIEIEDKREGHNNLLALNFPLGIKSHFRRLCTVAYSAAKKEIIIERTVGSNQYEICIGWGD